MSSNTALISKSNTIFPLYTAKSSSTRGRNGAYVRECLMPVCQCRLPRSLGAAWSRRQQKRWKRCDVMVSRFNTVRVRARSFNYSACLFSLLMCTSVFFHFLHVYNRVWPACVRMRLSPSPPLHFIAFLGGTDKKGWRRRVVVTG